MLSSVSADRYCNGNGTGTGNGTGNSNGNGTTGNGPSIYTQEEFRAVSSF